MTGLFRPSEAEFSKAARRFVPVGWRDTAWLGMCDRHRPACLTLVPLGCLTTVVNYVRMYARLSSRALVRIPNLCFERILPFVALLPAAAAAAVSASASAMLTGLGLAGDEGSHHRPDRSGLRPFRRECPTDGTPS